MRTITKKELIDRIAERTKSKRILVKRVVQEFLDQIISEWTGQRDHYQVMHLLQAHGVAAGAVLKGSETIADPHLQARGFWDLVDHPEAGVYKQVTTPWKLSENPRKEATPAPGLGEHNAYVLQDLLGLAPKDVQDLADEGIVGTRPLGAEIGTADAGQGGNPSA